MQRRFEFARLQRLKRSFCGQAKTAFLVLFTCAKEAAMPRQKHE